jgi:hypothetical protein
MKEWINWQSYMEYQCQSYKDVYMLFLSIKMTDSVDKLAKLYVNKVVRLHGVPVSIVSNRDPRFTSHL